MDGYIHSFQSMGAVDGPGLRFVVFMQGCPLRCLYCHNPDTWEPRVGQSYSPREVADKILRFRPYFGEDGGVTVSGGEVLLQWEFTLELFKILKAEGIHTAIDTSGAGDLSGAQKLLKYTDLVICDIKFRGEAEYKCGCGGSFAQVKEFLRLTERMGISLWIRHVVVPGLTDSDDEVGAVIKTAEEFSNLEKIELLPFKKLCIPKYDALELEFPLKDTAECTAEKITELSALIPEKYR